MNNNPSEKFDVLFIGLGAANCLLLIKMNENGLLKGKKIAVIEPNEKTVGDKTFCFWATEKELLDLNLEHLISSKWQYIKVADCEPQKITPLHYYHIKGINLYNNAIEILREHGIRNYKELFSGAPVLKNETIKIRLADKNIEALKVFDSRPPMYEVARKNQSHLLQSFFGWEVKTQDYTFDISTMVMMDFNIPQNNSCQFIYILPFSEDTALIEVTRFGKEKITKEEAEIVLTEYLARLDFSYTILDEERGIIPMSSLKINNPNYGENWIYTGAGGDMIKPTTGYAFHNMAIDAQNQVEAIKNKRPFIRKEKPFRFNFYDTLLLKILEETPQQGKKIFHDLFKYFSINTILFFLSERTSLSTELHIFSKLPILIFLRAAIKDIYYRIASLSPSYYAFIFTLAAILLYSLGLKEMIGLFLGIGFLSVGLSHGALDYLTDKTIHNPKQLLQFIISYLSKGAILGLIWIILPDLALLTFIIFSAWHFGQADFKEWKYKQGFNSLIWGFIVLGIILLYHPYETIEVLEHIKGLEISNTLTSLSVDQLFIGKISFSIFAILFAAYNRSRMMLMTVSYLLLSSILPLIVSFGIYFVVQHSLQGWRHLKIQLKSTSYNLWLKALPFSAGGALLILIFMLANKNDYMGVFFILLSCISLPHILTMHHFYARFREK